MDNREIQHHIVGTYRSLRYGMAGIGLVFPLFLLAVGALWYGVAPQTSMSAYYFAEPSGPGPMRDWPAGITVPPFAQLLFFLDQLESQAPMRSWFVGALFVLGACLYLYKGFSHLENWLLNAAGLLAVGVALFPMAWDCSDTCPSVTLHDVSAIMAFVCLSAVALLCSKQTLSVGLPPERQRLYRTLYNVTAWLMVLFPLLALAGTWLVGKTTQAIFWIEALGLWSFSAYWLIKSQEMRENRAEVRAAEGELRTSAEPVMKEVPPLKKLRPAEAEAD